MKSDDNIEKFFEKRLGDFTEMEDGWNVPSDDIWNSAKVHFPKEKKKDRPFLYFLFGAGTMLLLSLSVGYYFFTKNDLIENTITPITFNENKIDKQEEIDLSLNEVATFTNETNSEKEKEIIVSNIKSSTNSREKEVAKNKTNFIKGSLQKTFDTKKKQTHFLTENTNQKAIETKHNLLNNDQNNINQNESLTLEKPLPIVIEKVEKITNNKVINLPSLISKLESEERPITNNSEIIKLKSARKINRWEMGLSHSPLILLPVVRADFKEDEDVNLDVKYRNLNGLISRRLNRRFSLTSGLMFSSLDVGLDFGVEGIYEMDEVDVDFKGILPNNSSGGSLTIDDTTSDLDIIFRPDANLMNGDSVFVKGKIPFEVKAIQLPFLVNYHFGKGKFEGLIHAGGSLDYFDLRVRSLDFDVFKDDNLISESVNFEPEKYTGFGVSAYLGAGVKYHLNDHFNLGLSTKFNVTALIFSTYELGVYYGF